MSLTMWWPSPEAFDNLTVEDAETGFTLSAPDNTECGEWLAHWNQTEEHQKVFNEAFNDSLKSYLSNVKSQDGETEAISDE
jgi:hypothetical protein